MLKEVDAIHTQPWPFPGGKGTGLFWRSIGYRLAMLLVLSFIGFAHAGVYMNQEQALTLAFSSHAVTERVDVFLKKDEVAQIQKRAKSKLSSEIITYHIGTIKGELVGYAFFETHIVRTMPETFMVVLDKEGAVQFVEMLAFHEPEDYRPPKKWMDLFKNKKLDKHLWVKRGIRNITGSTLTTQAITAGVRRILAAYEVLIKK